MSNRRLPPEPQDVPMTVDQMKQGIRRIQKRIVELEAFDPRMVSERYGPEVRPLQTAIEATLTAIFGPNTVKYNRYSRATELDHGGVSMYRDTSLEAVRHYVAQGKQEAIALLGQAIRDLEEDILDHESTSASRAVQPPTGKQRNLSGVFIVHGHDGEVREAVARFIERLGFEAVILHEQPNKGRTIITKFSEEAQNVGFAVILLTADDIGKANNAPDLRHRARQNVIFELGFFIGKLGPACVAPIVKGEIELPSDFDGVVYISFDGEDWRTKLGRELQAAGYKIDWNKVMG